MAGESGRKDEQRSGGNRVAACCDVVYLELFSEVDCAFDCLEAQGEVAAVMSARAIPSPRAARRRPRADTVRAASAAIPLCPLYRLDEQQRIFSCDVGAQSNTISQAFTTAMNVRFVKAFDERAAVAFNDAA
jgi:hypothetical protein